jgi:hypothetical protein
MTTVCEALEELDNVRSRVLKNLTECKYHLLGAFEGIYEHELFKTFTKEDRDLLEDWVVEVLSPIEAEVKLLNEERDAAFSKCRDDLVIARRIVKELEEKKRLKAIAKKKREERKKTKSLK